MTVSFNISLLGLSKRTTCVYNIQALIALHRNCLCLYAPSLCSLHESLPVSLPVRFHNRIPPQFVPLPYNHLLWFEAALLQCALNKWSIVHRTLGSLNSARSGQYDSRLRRFDSLGQGCRGKTAEYNGVDGAETRSGKDTENRSRYHGHCAFLSNLDHIPSVATPI